MSDITEILSGIEGLAPEAIAAIEALVKSKETELSANLEAKYGVKPSLVSDVTAAVEDVAPAVVKAAESTPAGTTLESLLSRLNSLEQQNAQLKEKIDNPEQVIASGGGDPVPHNLFLSDGTVIKNHGGIATSYSTTNPDGSESVRKVIAAYPA